MKKITLIVMLDTHRVTLCKICQNTRLLWPVYSRTMKKSKILTLQYKRKYGSEKTRILAYFTQCDTAVAKYEFIASTSITCATINGLNHLQVLLSFNVDLMFTCRSKFNINNSNQMEHKKIQTLKFFVRTNFMQML